jgi:hypothetical protein
VFNERFTRSLHVAGRLLRAGRAWTRVEVLSSSTEDYDRGTKFKHYRTIPSLRTFLLVSQDKMLVEHWTRQDAHTWVIQDYTTPEQEFRIEAIGVIMTMTDIYDGVELCEAETTVSTTED